MTATTSESAPADTVSKSGAPPPRATRGGSRALLMGERFGLLILLAAVVVYWSVRFPNTFATADNWRTIATSQSVTVVIALALMVPLLSGNFDLSVGSIAGLSAMVSAGLMSRDGLNLVEAIVVVLAIGAAIGVVNGLLVTRFGLNGLIATLGSATVIDGLVTWYSKNLSISSGFSARLVNFGTDTLFGIPWLAITALALSAIVGYSITQTPFGRKLLAIGSSSAAARLVGVRVNRHVQISYVTSGLLGAVAGVLLLAQQGSASPGANGIGTLLPALAAVYLGASTWTPGQFNVIGTILGLLLVSVTVSGLTLDGSASWVGSVCYGAALILAVGASAAFRRKRRGS